MQSGEEHVGFPAILTTRRYQIAAKLTISRSRRGGTIVQLLPPRNRPISCASASKALRSCPRCRSCSSGRAGCWPRSRCALAAFRTKAMSAARSRPSSNRACRWQPRFQDRRRGHADRSQGLRHLAAHADRLIRALAAARQQEPRPDRSLDRRRCVRQCHRDRELGRRTGSLDRGNRFAGCEVDRRGGPPGVGSPAHHHHHVGPRQRRHPHRRIGRPDQGDRRADQSSGAQRHRAPPAPANPARASRWSRPR
jgi:hypothetical protein